MCDVINGMAFFLLCTVGDAKGIEIEPRVGIYYSKVWGIHAGALTSVQLSDKFYLQPK